MSESILYSKYSLILEYLKFKPLSTGVSPLAILALVLEADNISEIILCEFSMRRKLILSVRLFYVNFQCVGS